MHLLLGDPADECVAAARDALEARGHSALALANPLVEPSRFSWRFDTERSESAFAWDGEALRDDLIDGVLVLGAGWVDPTGWKPADLAYAQAETHAALLAWLWSLACPVVNRYPPAIWYRPQAPLPFWHGLLRRCGLPAPETLATNVEHEARAFGRRQATEHVDGIVYGALTSAARYLVTSEEDWRGLAALQRVTPVCLTAPHGPVRAVCVVGSEVVWDDGDPCPQAERLEPALQRFAAAAGLSWVELALAPTAQGLCVVAVEANPRLERFGEGPREAIVDGLVRLLVTGAGR